MNVPSTTTEFTKWTTDERLRSYLVACAYYSMNGHSEIKLRDMYSKVDATTY